MKIGSALRQAAARVWAFVNRRTLDREFTQELESHLSLSADDHMRRGLTPQAARRAALAELGSRAALADRHRDARAFPTVDELLQDVRYGFRVLRRRPAGSAVAILTIALGLGATTTLFSVAYGVLLKPLPFADEHQILQLQEWREGGDTTGRPFLTRPTFEAWSAQSSTLQHMAAWNAATETVTLPGGMPERARIAQVSASWLQVLGVPPQRGVTFTAEQEADGRQVALVSHGFWQRAFGGQPDAIGRSLMVGGEPRTIIGVMPPDFAFPNRETILWEPLGRDLFVLNAVGRLTAGASIQQAADEGTARSRAVADQGRRGVALFGSTGLSHITAVPLRDAITAGMRPIILLVFAGGALLLGIAIVNVAGVQLARTAERRRELAIRTAIGAAWTRIARQIVIENLVVSGLAGAAGLVLAVFLNRLLPRFASIGIARIEDVRIDLSVLLFAGAATIGVGVACGLLPALLAGSRRDVTHGLLDRGATSVGAQRVSPARARWLLMAGQVTLAVVLLSGASLVTRSFISVMTIDRGFESSHLLTARLPFPSRDFTRVQRADVLDQIVTRLGQTPGVAHAAATDILPLIDLEFPRAFELPATAGSDVVAVKVMSRSVTRDYFSTLGMRLVEGRVFDAGDTLTSVPVAVVNQTFVRRYLEGRTALGTPLPVRYTRDKINWQIAGIVADVRNQHAADPPQPEVFGCVCQMEGGMLNDFPAIVVRTTADAGALAPAVRRVVSEAAPTTSLDSVMTMEDRLRHSVAGQRLSTALFAGFAGFALVVVGIGLFGVLSFNVAQRARELAVRKALGASHGDVLSVVIRQAVTIIGPGLVLGVLVALAISRHYQPLLFGVRWADPLTLVIVPAMVGLVTLAATVAPALRATRLDPMQILKDA